MLSHPRRHRRPEESASAGAKFTKVDSVPTGSLGHSPAQALRLYRDEFVSDAKAIVVGMTSNEFTLADPNDRGMLDVVGFDATAPAVIADFVRE